LGLFCKSMSEHYRITYKETEYSVSIRAKLDSTLPNLFSSNKLLRDFSRQRIEKLLYRTFAINSLIEDNGSIHKVMLTWMLTSVKRNLTCFEKNSIDYLMEARKFDLKIKSEVTVLLGGV